MVRERVELQLEDAQSAVKSRLRTDPKVRGNVQLSKPTRSHVSGIKHHGDELARSLPAQIVVAVVI